MGKLLVSDPLRFAGYNACTLREQGRRELVAKQFAQHKLHMIGIQEARKRKSTTHMFGDFIVIPTAANDANSYGVELWISTKLPVGHTDHQPFPNQAGHHGDLWTLSCFNN